VRWKLFSATWVCAARRVRRALAANPLLAALALVGAVAAPIGAVAAGARLADSFRASAAEETFVTALALGVGTTGLVAGIALALLAPGTAAIGSELLAAPATRLRFVAATVVAPTLAAGSGLVALAALFAVPLADGLGLLIVLALAVSLLFGATLGEGAAQCARRDRTGPVTVAAVAAAWAITGRLAGAGAELGPAGALVRAVDRNGARWWLGLWLGVLGLAAAAGWLAAAARPAGESRARDRSRPIRLPRRAPFALLVVTVVRLVRHPQLRLNAAAAVVVPCALSLAAAAALDVGGAPLVAFAGGLALTAAAVYPLAARGLADDARWLLRGSPARSSSLAAAVSAAGSLVAAGVVAAALIVALPVARADVATYGQLEAASAFLLGCAAFSGALVPWRPDAVVQQIASYGALIVTVVFAWALAGRLEPLAAASGLTDAGFALLVGNAVLLAGVSGSAVVAR
jgi:hypothetical protein